MIVGHVLINQYRVNLRSRNLIVILIVNMIISRALINQYRVSLSSGNLTWNGGGRGAGPLNLSIAVCQASA